MTMNQGSQQEGISQEPEVEQPVKMSSVAKKALIITLPVFFGYLFLGIGFGIMLQRAGYSFVWAIVASTTILSGTMQYILVSLLGGGYSLLTIAVMTFTVNSRYMFYGLSFLEKFKAMGKLYPYMIFSLTDETYSLLYNTKAKNKQEEKPLFFLIAFFNQIYWLIGSTLGAVLGELITFNSTGIDFAMTALFVVIFIDQWRNSSIHLPQIIGLIIATFALLFLGAENFMLPAIGLSIVLLLALQKSLSAKLGLNKDPQLEEVDGDA